MTSTYQYFAEGLTKDVISALGRFTELTVMSWNAVWPLKGKPASPGEIPPSAVRYQLEGSVRRSGDRVRVTAQLVNSDGQVLGPLVSTRRFPTFLCCKTKSRPNRWAWPFAFRRRNNSGHLPSRLKILKHMTMCYAQHPRRFVPTVRTSWRLDSSKTRIELDPTYSTAYTALAETYHSAVSMGWAELPAEFLVRAEEMRTGPQL